MMTFQHNQKKIIFAFCALVCVILVIIYYLENNKKNVGTTIDKDGNVVNLANTGGGRSWWETGPNGTGTGAALSNYWNRLWGTPTPTTDKPTTTTAPGEQKPHPSEWWDEYGEDIHQRPAGHTQSPWQKEVTTHPQKYYYGNNDHKRIYN